MKNFQPKTTLSSVCTFLTKRNDASDPTGRVAEVYNYVANVRQLVYDHPRLAQRSHKPKSLISSERKKVWEKKSTERYFFERLSQYYPLGEVGGNEDKAVWSRLSLLEACKLVSDHPSNWLNFTDLRPSQCWRT